jgi:hypothetical protein
MAFDRYPERLTVRRSGTDVAPQKSHVPYHDDLKLVRIS